MRVEQIRLKNFRALQDVTIRDIPKFAVIVGANGTGKSTLFSVFGFLKDAMTFDVTTALTRLGGNKGLQEVRSRDSEGPIKIEIKFRTEHKGKLTTYILHVGEDKNGKATIAKEVLQYRRGSRGRPWRLLDFANGTGTAVTNEIDGVTNEKDLKREPQTLKSPDILAIKGLAQFERFPASVALGNLIERWRLSDFHEEESISLAAHHLHKQHPNIFDNILDLLSRRVPGISKIETSHTEDGRILIKFQDGSFKEPFLAPSASDGTIKMLAYLTLLHHPSPRPLLCVEEPENQLYPNILDELVEEFEHYAKAKHGGQVLVSTRSPDFLNAVDVNSVFFLSKKNGRTTIQRAKDNKQIREHTKNGALMGDLWKEGWFAAMDPRTQKNTRREKNRKGALPSAAWVG